MNTAERKKKKKLWVSAPFSINTRNYNWFLRFCGKEKLPLISGESQ